MNKNIVAIVLLLTSEISLAHSGRKVAPSYSHSTVGTAAQDATGSVTSGIRGWLICHDAGSASDYLAVSDGADPDTDGVRLAAGDCLECLECSEKSLTDANVKGSAAATGYAVIQLK